MSRTTFLTHLECPKCGQTLDPSQPRNLCACGSPLLARYDLAGIGRAVAPRDLAGRRTDMWRYREFLPVARDENIISLGEGMTPLLRADGLGDALGLANLYIKDEGPNPTGSFKARGASAGISMARELGVKVVAMPTAGNAGGAWAAYGAKAGIEAHIVMPVDAPELAKKECHLTGAHTYLVKGLISDAGKIVGRAVKRYGWFDASTLKEPYRIEGKKTMGFELAEQFGWEVPDVILYPTGGGVGLIGIWKALDELEAVGWIGPRRPRMVSVQAEGCMPIVRAFREGRRESTFWEGAATVAGGLRVPKALGDFLVLDALYRGGGTAVAIPDEETMECLMLTARVEGMFICPEGAAAVAATRRLAREGWIRPDERVVILNTGTGLKYPEVVEPALPVLEVDDDIVV
jgi:threonine synthase